LVISHDRQVRHLTSVELNPCYTADGHPETAPLEGSYFILELPRTGRPPHSLAQLTSCQALALARTGLSVTVGLRGRRGAELWPWPRRVFAVGPSHTFMDLARAINTAFARWDHSHLCLFTLADGREVTDRETAEETALSPSDRSRRVWTSRRRRSPRRWGLVQSSGSPTTSATTGCTGAWLTRRRPIRSRRSVSVHAPRCRTGAGDRCRTSTGGAGRATTAPMTVSPAGRPSPIRCWATSGRRNSTRRSRWTSGRCAGPRRAGTLRRFSRQSPGRTSTTRCSRWPPVCRWPSSSSARRPSP